MATPSTTKHTFLSAAADALTLANGLPPIKGKWFFVDPQNGSSTADGLTPQTAMDTLLTAYNACTDGAGDGICLLSGGTTTAHTTSYLHAALTWSKYAITVYGVCAPTRMAQRARIANDSGHLDLAKLISITGHNNAFYNISLFNGGTTGAGCVEVTGDRNYFKNVHFMGGMGMTTPTVNDYSLLLNGADENTFEDCVIGTDTFDKGDIAAAELHLQSGCARNRFINCEFLAYHSTGTTAGLIKLVGAGDSITRTHVFDNCFFQIYDDGNAPSEAALVIGTAPNNGHLVFKNCLRLGITDWAGVATGRVYSGAGTMAEAGGIAIVANPS